MCVYLTSVVLEELSPGLFLVQIFFLGPNLATNLFFWPGWGRPPVPPKSLEENCNFWKLLNCDSQPA